MLLPPILLSFENAAGQLLEHPAGYAVLRYLPGQRKLAELQALLTQTGRLLQRHNWQKFLIDQRAMSPFTDGERAWIHVFWRANQQQRQHTDTLFGAVILAQNAFARLAMRQLVHESDAALAYHLFEDEASAVAWLQRLPLGTKSRYCAGNRQPERLPTEYATVKFK